MKYYKLTRKKEIVEVSMEEGLLQYGKIGDEGKRVDLTEDENYSISTVFLVMDHSFGLDGPPLVFETMVFPLYSLEELDRKRYSTWEEAKEGHRKMCERWLKPQTYLPIYTGKRLITFGDENAG